MKTPLKPLICAALLSCFTPALAQRSSDPNLHNFYMARQQVEIIDESPIVNDKRTNPQPQNPSTSGGVGNLNGRQPLPKAGWQPYAQTVPGVPQGAGLPKVNNGVPQISPTSINSQGLSGNAGRLNLQNGGNKPYGGNSNGNGNNRGSGIQTASPNRYGNKTANGSDNGGPNGLNGNPGKLGHLANPHAPLAVQTYKAYKGYGGKLTPTTVSGTGSSTGAGLSSKSSVQGNVLHWKPKKN